MGEIVTLERKRRSPQQRRFVPRFARFVPSAPVSSLPVPDSSLFSKRLLTLSRITVECMHNFVPTTSPHAEAVMRRILNTTSIFSLVLTGVFAVASARADVILYNNWQSQAG
jgi:hypothetical protein